MKLTILYFLVVLTFAFATALPQRLSSASEYEDALSSSGEDAFHSAEEGLSSNEDVFHSAEGGLSSDEFHSAEE